MGLKRSYMIVDYYYWLVCCKRKILFWLEIYNRLLPNNQAVYYSLVWKQKRSGYTTVTMGAGTKPYVRRRHPAEGGKPAAPERAWSRTGQLPPPRVARIGAALRCSCNGNSHSRISEDASCMATSEPINKLQQDPIQPMVRQADRLEENT